MHTYIYIYNLYISFLLSHFLFYTNLHYSVRDPWACLPAIWQNRRRSTIYKQRGCSQLTKTTIDAGPRNTKYSADQICNRSFWQNTFLCKAHIWFKAIYYLFNDIIVFYGWSFFYLIISPFPKNHSHR